MNSKRQHLLGISIPRIPKTIPYLPVLRDIDAASTINGILVGSVLLEALHRDEEAIIDDYRLSVMADITREEMLWAKRNLLKNGYFWIEEDQEEEAGESCWLDHEGDWIYLYHKIQWVADIEMIKKYLEHLELAT